MVQLVATVVRVNLAGARVVLFHPDPLPPGFIGQVPQLDLDLFVVDLHRRAYRVRIAAAPRLAVAALQDDVDRLTDGIPNMLDDRLYQALQVVRPGLRLLADELLGRVHRAGEICPGPGTRMALAIRYRHDHAGQRDEYHQS